MRILNFLIWFINSRKIGTYVADEFIFSYPLIRIRTCVYQGVRNVSFSENFAYVLNEWHLWRWMHTEAYFFTLSSIHDGAFCEEQCFFSLFFFLADTGNLQERKKREELSFFLSPTFTRPQTFRHLFETLYLRLLPRISNRSACNYQTDYCSMWFFYLLELAFGWILIEFSWIVLCCGIDATSFCKNSSRKVVDLNSYQLMLHC